MRPHFFIIIVPERQPDTYSTIKNAFDRLKVPTQILLAGKTVRGRPSSSLLINVLRKINQKLLGSVL